MEWFTKIFIGYPENTLFFSFHDLSQIMPIDFTNADRYVYLQAISSAFTAYKKIPVTSVNGFLFIQTDKPLYTPEQEG